MLNLSNWGPVALKLLIIGVVCSSSVSCHRDEHDHKPVSEAHDHKGHAGNLQAEGHEQVQGAWRITQAQMPVMPPGQNRAAVYLHLQNRSEQERTILGAASPIAGVVEVHRHLYEDGMMKMRHVPHLPVAAQSSVLFEPGGYHIMLIDVANPPEVGSRFPVTMMLDGGESLVVDVEVRPRS
jgi:copper(I)-binding protein